MDKNAVQKRLQEARGDKSLKEVAKDLGISVSSLCMYESGSRVPRDEIKELIAQYYGISVGTLFFNE